VARVAPLGVQKYHFTMSLEASPCSLPVSVMRVSVGSLIWDNKNFYFLFSIIPKY